MRHTVRFMPLELERINKLTMELRRGILILTALASLQQEHYGYSLRKKLIDAGLDIDEGTLYPLLSRMKRAELVSYQWEESKSGPPRKVYTVTPEGRKTLTTLEASWRRLDGSVNKLIKHYEASN